MWSEFWPQKKKTIIPTKHHECPSNMGYQLTKIVWTQSMSMNHVCPGSGEFLPNRRRIHWDPWCLPGSWEDLISIAFQKIPSTRLVETRMMCNSRSSWRRPSSTFTCSSVTSISSARTSGSSTQRWHWSNWSWILINILIQQLIAGTSSTYPRSEPSLSTTFSALELC